MLHSLLWYGTRKYAPEGSTFPYRMPCNPSRLPSPTSRCLQIPVQCEIDHHAMNNEWISPNTTTTTTTKHERREGNAVDHVHLGFDGHLGATAHSNVAHQRTEAGVRVDALVWDCVRVCKLPVGFVWREGEVAYTEKGESLHQCNRKGSVTCACVHRPRTTRWCVCEVGSRVPRWKGQ